MIGLLPRLVRAVLAGIGTACETLIPGPNIHGYRLDFAEALAEAEAEQDVSEPRFPPCPDVDKCKYCPTNDGIDCTLSCNKVEQDWLAADPDQTSAATPPAAVDDPAGGAPASAPLPSAGSPSVPAGVSARPKTAAPSAGLDPVGTIRTLPNAVAVRIIDGAWSVIWHQWGADTDISEQSWVYRDGSPMAARIAANWPILVRGPAVPLAEACLAVGVSIASEFFPQHRSTCT